MTGAVPDAADERRGLWLDVLRWPLSGGMLGIVIAFAALAAASAALEGGPSQAVRETRSFLQAGVFLAAVLLLGVASRRAIACTWPAERPVPWFRDEIDDAPLAQAVGTYLAVLLVAFLPMAAWLTLRGPVGAPAWVSWLVVGVASVHAGATLPLGLAAAAVKGSPAAAFPGTVAKMRRAEPYAARVAAVTGVVFVGAIVLSFLMADLAPHPTIDMSRIEPRPASEPVGPALRWSIAAVRAAAFYSAIVSCRVSGLLVREVPAIREVLA